MASINKVVLIGNMVRDPELRNISSGTAVTKLGIAVKRRWNSRQNEKQDITDFFDVTVWGKQAELCCEYLRKGQQVAIEGRLQKNSWETEDGQKRSSVDIIAENVQFLGSRRDVVETSGSERNSDAAGKSEEIYDKDIDDLEFEDSVEEEVPF